MRGFMDWLVEKENVHFIAHVAAVLVLAYAAQLAAPDYTQGLFPAILLLAASSFMYTYPVDAIKKQGLFAEYLIETRLLWFVAFGVLAEYAAYALTELNYDLAQHAAVLAAMVAGLALAFYCRASLKQKIVASRGWK